MPLEEGCDKETISRNIGKLIREGYEQDQAVAIAYNKCKELADETPTITRPAQSDVHYLMKSVTRNTCDTCRWFAKDYGCHIVENNPDDIDGAGCCDRHEAKAIDEPVLPVSDAPVADGETPVFEAIPDAPVTEPDTTVFAVPKSNTPTVFNQLVQKLKGGLKPGSTVIRGKDGRRYMFIVTSNSYQDRDGETITTDALKQYVDSHWTAEDYFHADNKHLVWHMDDLDVGNIVWADMAGPFLVEVAREGDTVIAQAAYDYWEQNPDALGASHRFQYHTHHRDSDGTYQAIRKLETSTLPRSDAANLLTYSGVIPMSKARDAYLDKMFGIEGVAGLLKEGPEKLAAELEAKGVQHKSADDPAQETRKAEGMFSELVLRLAETQADTLAELDTLKALLDEMTQQRAAEKAAAETALQAQVDELAALKAEFDLSPRSTRATLSKTDVAEAKAEITERGKTPYAGNSPVKRLASLIEGSTK